MTASRVKLNPEPVAKADKHKDGGGLYFAKSSVTCIPTGSKLLDLVLGGGWAVGRIANVVGDKSTGKTLLAIEAIANFKHKFGDKAHVTYCEAESAFDKAYANELGIPIDGVRMVEDCDTVEQFYNDLVKHCARAKESKTPSLYILDSLDALSDEAETKRDMTEGTYGATKAKQMSQLFRRATRILGESDTALIIISQVRDKIGVTFGRKTTRSGGRALDFSATHIVYLSHLARLVKTVKGRKRVTGVKIKAMCEKNKLAVPFRECEFPILFRYGIDDMKSCLEWLAEEEKVLEDKIGYKTVSAAYGKVVADPSAQADVHKAVEEVWNEIEHGFTPTEKKYK